MTQLVFKELGRLNNIGTDSTLNLAKIDFNLTTTASAELISLHVRVKFHDCIFVSLCSNIEHHAQFRLQILAYSLEEPLVRVDLSVVTVLNAEADMDTTSFENVVVKSYIPSCHLPDMEQVLRNVFGFHFLIHYIFYVSELKLPFTIFLHEAFVHE